VQKKHVILALQILRFQRRKQVGPVKSIPYFLVTKRLQLRFKKNAAAEPNGLFFSKPPRALLQLIYYKQHRKLIFKMIFI
jgi:hypothetical protein